MLLTPINLLLFLLFEYLIEPNQKNRNHSYTESQRLEIACVQCERKRRFIIYDTSSDEQDGSIFNTSIPKCINHLQYFSYKKQDIQSKENGEKDSGLINWMAKFVHIYLTNNDSNKECIKCQKRNIKYWRNINQTDSSHFQYIHEHIFFIYSTRQQCRNPNFQNRRLNFVPNIGNKTSKMNILGKLVKLKSHVAKTALDIKYDSSKKDQIFGNNMTLKSLRSSCDIASTVISCEGSSEFKRTSLSENNLKETIVEQAPSSMHDRIFSSDKSKKEVLLSVHLQSAISSTVTSSEGRSDFEMTSFSENTLTESIVEEAPSPMQDKIFSGDSSKKEVPSSAHQSAISSTVTSSEERSNIEMSLFSENTLKELTVEQMQSLMEDNIFSSASSSKEVLSSVSQSDVSSTVTSSKGRPDIVMTSFSENTLTESIVEHAPSVMQDKIFSGNSSRKEVPLSAHQSDISSTVTSSKGRSDFEMTSFSENTLTESIIDHTPSLMQDEAFRNDIRNTDIFILKNIGITYTTKKTLSVAEISRSSSYVPETQSASNVIEETLHNLPQKTYLEHSQVIASPVIEKMGDTVLKSSYLSYKETIVADATSSLKMGSVQKATPHLAASNMTPLKSTLFPDLSGKLGVSLQRSVDIDKTSARVKAQREDLDTEKYHDAKEASLEKRTESIEASMIKSSFLPLVGFDSTVLKSRDMPDLLSSKIIPDESVEMSKSYTMTSSTFTKVENDHRIVLSATKYGTLPPSKIILEKSMSKVDVKEGTVDLAEEAYTQKLSASKLSATPERTSVTRDVPLSRPHSEVPEDMSLSPSTLSKFAGRSLQSDILTEENGIDILMAYSQSYFTPKNVHKSISAGTQEARKLQMVGIGAPSKIPNSKEEVEQKNKKNQEGEIAPEKLSASLEISREVNTHPNSSKFTEKSLLEASESIDPDTIGTRKFEIDPEGLETMTRSYSDVLAGKTVLLSQIESSSRISMTLMESKKQGTTAVTANTELSDLKFGQEHEKIPHLIQKEEIVGSGSSKMHGAVTSEYKVLDGAFGSDYDYNGSAVVPVINRKEIEEGRIFVLSPDFVILLTLLILACYRLFKRSMKRFSPSKGGNIANQGNPQLETVTTSFDIFMKPGGEIKFEMRDDFKVTL